MNESFFSYSAFIGNNNSSSLSSSSSSNVRKRAPFIACASCQTKHCACDDQRPCSTCVRLGLQCVEGVPRKARKKPQKSEPVNRDPYNQLERELIFDNSIPVSSPSPSNLSNSSSSTASSSTASSSSSSSSSFSSSFLSSLPPSIYKILVSSSSTSVDKTNLSNVSNLTGNIESNDIFSPYPLASVSSRSSSPSPSSSSSLYSPSPSSPSPSSSSLYSPSSSSPSQSSSSPSHSSPSHSSPSHSSPSHSSPSSSPPSLSSLPSSPPSSLCEYQSTLGEDNLSNNFTFVPEEVLSVTQLPLFAPSSPPFTLLEDFNVINNTNNNYYSNNNSNYDNKNNYNNDNTIEIYTNNNTQQSDDTKANSIYSLSSNSPSLSKNPPEPPNQENTKLVNQLQKELNELREELAAVRHREKLAFPLIKRVRPKDSAMSLWSLQEGYLVDYSLGFAKLMKYAEDTLKSFKFYQMCPPETRVERRYLHIFFMRDRPEIKGLNTTKSLVQGDNKILKIMTSVTLFYFEDEVLLQLLFFLN